MTALPDIKNLKIEIDKIECDFIQQKNIKLSVLRLDKIHPEISGNKFFKLYYYLQSAEKKKEQIITFGGAYSNHLAATAAACKLAGIKCIGIVRGEELKPLSHTLITCINSGMKLKFIDRDKYRLSSQDDFKKEMKHEFGEHILIPEGGYSTLGVKGVELISQFFKEDDYNCICCSVGTATTMSGIIQSSSAKMEIIGFSALKNLNDFNERINFLINPTSTCKYHLNNDYHFGGYAKKTEALIKFMNKTYFDFNMPSDFVYTGKMFYGVFDLIEKNYFKEGSSILCIHTGGLQGNLSLPAGTLNF